MICDKKAIVTKNLPVWVQTNKILGTVLSFLPFGSQATKLRMVYNPFKASALPLLERPKIPMAFIRYDWASWSWTDARRGRSDEFTSKEAVTDEAICLAFAFRARTLKPVTFVDSDGESKEMDASDTRRILLAEGEYHLTPR
eukprot:scaffold1918_cov154-Amphora_coffeaeformis.AAC.13